MCSHFKFWSRPFLIIISWDFLPYDVAHPNLNVCCSHYNVGPKTCEKSLLQNFLIIWQIMCAYTCLFRCFFNIHTHIYDLKLSFSVEECHYCLNSKICLYRNHYIMLPRHCIILASLLLFWVHTNISTYFKASCFTTLYHTFTVLKITYFFEFLRFC